MIILHSNRVAVDSAWLSQNKRQYNKYVLSGIFVSLTAVMFGLLDVFFMSW